MHLEAQALNHRLRPAAVLFIAGILAAAAAAAGTAPAVTPLSPYTTFSADEAGGIGSPALSPDGSRLAFVHRYDPLGANPAAVAQLFIARTDGTFLVQATSSDSVSDPASPVFSHDGTVVYFTAVVAGTTCREVCRVTANGDGFRRLTFQTAARGVDAIERVAPVGDSAACFCTASDLLDEGLDLDRDVRNIYRVGPDGTLARLSDQQVHPLERAEILGGSMDDSLLCWVAVGPGLPHGRPLRPCVLHTAGGLYQPLTGDQGSTDIEGAVAAGGRRLAFSSTAEYLGGPGGSQIYRVELSGENLEQLTWVGTPGAGRPVIDSAGVRVAFESAASILLGDVTGKSRVYTLTGVSDLVRVSSGRSAAIAADGSRIAYVDEADSLGQNGDGSPEIFSVRPDGTDRRQHSRFVPGISEQARISTDGNRVVFASTADLDGGNPDGSREIYLASSAGGDLKRLTSSAHPFGCRQPAIAAGGLFVVFCSNADLVAGWNSDHNYEVFRVGADGNGLIQITRTTSGHSYTPLVSADGGTVAFVTTSNVVTGAPMGMGRVAVWKEATDHTRLVTASSDRTIESLFMNDQGTRIALLTAGNISNRNPSWVRRPFTVTLPGDTLRTPLFSGVNTETGLGMSPDGEWLALAQYDDAGRVIRIPFGGGAADTIFSSANVVPACPTLSAGGAALAFACRSGVGSFATGDYYVVHPGGGGAVPLIGASQALEVQPPSMSGNGKLVAFVAAHADSMNPDGSTEVFLADFGATPVSLLDFRAGRTVDGAVRVTWRAEADAGHLHFLVERSFHREGSYREISGPVRSATGSFEYLDREAPTDVTCWYRLAAVDRLGGTERFGALSVEPFHPAAKLLRVYPNPARGSCRVRFVLPEAGPAVVRVVDVSGRLVRQLHDGPAPAGRTEVSWDGRDQRGMEVAGGLYYVQLKNGPAVPVTLTR